MLGTVYSSTIDTSEPIRGAIEIRGSGHIRLVGRSPHLLMATSDQPVTIVSAGQPAQQYQYTGLFLPE